MEGTEQRAERRSMTGTDVRDRGSDAAEAAAFLRRSAIDAPTKPTADTLERNAWRDRPECGDPGRFVADTALQRHIERVSQERGTFEAALRVNGKHVDGFGPTSGVDRQNNCVECSRAVSETLSGRPAAANGLRIDLGATEAAGENLDDLEVWAGRKFGKVHPVDEGLAVLQREMATKEGESAIVAVRWKTEWEMAQSEGRAEDLRRTYEELRSISAEHAQMFLDDIHADRGGHAFNAVTTGGEVVLVDGQVGRHGSVIGSEYSELIRQRARTITWMTLEKAKRHGE